MKNELIAQLEKLKQSVSEAKNAPFTQKMQRAEKAIDESLQMCVLLVEENIKLNQKLEGLTNV